MRRLLYIFMQITWGMLQTLAGFLVFLAYVKRPHFMHHGAVVTTWSRRQGLSLGMFLFLPDPIEDELLVHEYGHSVQSLVLGPLYLLIIGLPSVLWSRHPSFARRRNERGMSYYDFLPEKNASDLGSLVLHRQAIR